MGAVPSSDRDLDFFGWLGNEIGSEKLQKKHDDSFNFILVKGSIFLHLKTTKKLQT